MDRAGIEGEIVLAEAIAGPALAGGALPYRDGWLYLESRLDGLRYIRSVSPRSPEGHDVPSFLIDVNDPGDPPARTPLDPAPLERRALLMPPHPRLAYAGHAWAV